MEFIVYTDGLKKSFPIIFGGRMGIEPATFGISFITKNTLPKTIKNLSKKM